MNVAIGIDVGTTGTKVAALDADGRILASSYVEYTCSYPQPNWVEQDAEELVDAAIHCLTETAAILNRLDERPGVAGISLSAQRCCLLLVDEHGWLTRPMISWQDNRPVSEVDELRTTIGYDAFFERTGTPLSTTLLMPKLMWVRAHEPEVFARSTRAVQLHDYLIRALGADEYYCDVPDAVLYGAWSSERREIDTEFFRSVELDPALLPEFVEPGTVVGTLSAGIAELVGLDASTPLVVGAGDQFVAAVGAGVVEHGQTSISLGTGGMAISVQGSYHTSDEHALMTTNHVVDGLWQLEGYQAGAAGVYRWFRDQLGQPEVVAAADASVSPYELLDQLVTSAPPGSRGLITLPYWASAAAPRWNNDARGAIVGLTFAHDRACLARSLLEGITLDMRDILSAMERSGAEIGEIRVLGGSTRSALWNQLQADVYGRPVVVMTNPDTAVVGAAMIAAVATGIHASLPDAAAAMVHVGDRFEPDATNTKLYDELYEVFTSVYQGLATTGFSHISRLQDALAEGEFAAPPT